MWVLTENCPSFRPGGSPEDTGAKTRVEAHRWRPVDHMKQEVLQKGQAPVSIGQTCGRKRLGGGHTLREFIYRICPQ